MKDINKEEKKSRQLESQNERNRKKLQSKKM